jgi:hypothetical protein
MKKFLLFILFPALLHANDLSLLHEALLESATTPHQKEVLTVYLETLEKKKAERIALLNESKKVSRGGKMAYTRVFHESIDKRIASIQ